MFLLLPTKQISRQPFKILGFFVHTIFTPSNAFFLARRLKKLGRMKFTGMTRNVNLFGWSGPSVLNDASWRTWMVHRQIVIERSKNWPRPRRDHGNGGTIYVFFTITTGHNSPITYWLIAVHSFSTSWSSWKTINKQLILGPWDDKKLSLVLSRQNMVGTPILSPYRNIVINPIVGVNIPGSQTTLTLPETIWN